MTSTNPTITPSINGNDYLRLEVNPLTLAFSGRCAMLEKPFLSAYAAKSLFQVRFALILGFFFYALFGLLDIVMAINVKSYFWLIRYGIVCPIIVLAFVFSYAPQFAKYMQPTIATLALIAGAGIIYMSVNGEVQLNSSYYVGLILILMIAYTFIKARFIWAVPANWTIVLVYIVAIAACSRLPKALVINNAFFISSANIIGMLVCYALEFYARHDFFLRHLLDNEHRRVEAANVALELKVQERTTLLARTNEELRREIQAHQRLDWEKRALEDQLFQAQKMETIGTLAGGIAHDFNNILAAVMGHTELALMQLDKPKRAEEALSKVLQASSRAQQLVQQILAFSRHGESELKPLQISLIVKEALNLLSATLPKSIAIKKDIRAEEDIVIADATQIHQILMNLCTNAAHAMRPQGGVLSVGLFRHDNESQPISPGNPSQPIGPGKHVCLSISDTGPGIPLHLRERIFDPYYTTKAQGVGTGLGLAVVRGIVQNHGGVIEVQSVAGQGTTFLIYLPRIEGKTQKGVRRLQVIGAGSEKIMLVDDDPALADLGAKLLAALGYRVTAEIDPQRALRVFADDPQAVDLVISDLMMPGMDGKVLAQEMLAIRPQLPVIIYTGFGDTLNIEALHEIGVSQILRKPITIYGLAQAIRQILEKRADSRKT